MGCGAVRIGLNRQYNTLCNTVNLYYLFGEICLRPTIRKNSKPKEIDAESNSKVMFSLLIS